MSAPSRRSGVAGRSFRALWLGQTVSALGTQVSLVALPLVAVLVLHVGPLELGILAALETLPYLVLALPAGVFIDRADRRWTMIACDLGRAVVLVGTALAIFTGVVSIALLCAVALVVGSLSVFFSVAYSTYVPSIVEADQLVDGNQRLELSDSAAQVLGPSIGGTVLQLAGGAATAALDGVSYLVSAIAILAARPVREPEPASRPERIAMFAGIGEGLRRVAGDRVLRDLAGSTGLFNLGSGMLLAVVVLFATTEVGLDAAGFGLVYGVGNVGFILGALAVGALTKRVGVGRAFAWSTYLGAVAMILIAIAGGAAGALLLLAGRFVGAVAAPLFNVNALSLRQARVSDEIMGRVNATFLFIDWGPLPIGSLLGGLLAGALGRRAALIAAAACGVAGAVWVRLSPAARLTSLTSPADSAARGASPVDDRDDIPHDPRLVA
ncbi:MAG: MFS transporter [Chloroflexota bacterium]